MRGLFIAILFLGAVLLRIPSAVAQFEEGQFTFGKVVSVSGDKLLLREYDFLKDETAEVTYFAQPETGYGNIGSLSELIVDDDVVIDYKEEKDRRSIMMIVRETKENALPAQQVQDPK